MANAERRQSPNEAELEAALEAKRLSILDLTDLFVVEGVGADVVSRVAEAAVERERQLREEVSRQNPFTILEQALNAAAATDAERFLAAGGRTQIQLFREYYTEAIRRVHAMANTHVIGDTQGTNFSMDAVMDSVNARAYGGTIYAEERQGNYYPSVTFMPLINEREVPPGIILTPEVQTAYAEKVLQSLGALGQGVPINSLPTTVPYSVAGKEGSGAYQRGVGKNGVEIRQLQTNMAGVDMRILLKPNEGPIMTMAMDIAAFNRTGIVPPSLK